MIRSVAALLTLTGCALPVHFPRGPDRCVLSSPATIGDPLAKQKPPVDHATIAARWRRRSCGVYDARWPLK